MSDFENFYNRTSKRLIAASFLLAALLDFIPLDYRLFFWLPEFSALILLYWALNRPHLVGLGCAFLVGLVIDIGISAPLGLHALSYTLMTFTVQHYQRQISLYSYGAQSLVVWLALTGNWLILTASHLFVERRFSGFYTLLAPIVGALLWPLLNKMMLTILHARQQRR